MPEFQEGCIIIIMLTDEALNNESIFMLSLTRKHNADYDGWGTVMVGDDVSMEELDELEDI